jgi:hypothetical protein
MKAKQQIGLTIKFFLALITASLAVSGQNLEIPKSEFSISLSKDKLELSRGEKEELEIMIHRSKSYQKSKAKMGFSSILPKGVEITFSPDKGTFDSSHVVVSIQKDATPGQYLLILNATLNNKTKGSILKIVIN